MRRYVHDVVVDTSGAPVTAAAAPEARAVRAWVGVVSRSHVRRGVAGGFAQLGHGKQSPLARMNVGDWLVYYSPATEFPDGTSLRAFTAIGRIVGERPYRVDMGRGFLPFRRDVVYAAGVREVPIRELASKLAFVSGRPHWGMLARRGHFEIAMADLDTIASAMGARLTKLRSPAMSRSRHVTDARILSVE